MSRITRSPGKLILSGEHAVVQGCPALAMAVSQAVEVQSQLQTEAALTLELPGRPSVTFPLSELPLLLDAVRRDHRAAADFRLEPETLLAACAAMHPPAEGRQLRFHSDIPTGAGLGSSAAYILALLQNLHPEMPQDSLFAGAVAGETFQHGRSSGLDVAVSLQGGLIRFNAGRISRPALPALPEFRVYHSGRPQSSTGDCVARSRQIFDRRPELKAAFTGVCNAMQQALETAAFSAWQTSIARNHALLCELEVVPLTIQKIISRLEAAGHAAKVCGAGSVSGDAAGMILVSGPGPHPVPADWQPLPVRLSPHGTRTLSS